MTSPRVVRRSSDLAAAADVVWAEALTPHGINAELGPWFRMTVPAAWRGRGLDDLTPPVTIGRSWVLLFGILPVDYDDLHIAELADHRFVERSTMLSAERWEHRRTVEPRGDGCRVSDEVTFTSRSWIRALPGGARLHERVIGATFGHRHRRLVRRWGSPSR